MNRTASDIDKPATLEGPGHLPGLETLPPCLGRSKPTPLRASGQTDYSVSTDPLSDWRAGLFSAQIADMRRVGPGNASALRWQIPEAAPLHRHLKIHPAQLRPRSQHGSRAHPDPQRVFRACAGRAPGWLVLWLLWGTAFPTSISLAQETTPLARTLNTPRAFAPPASTSEWQDRAREIREQILVSAGLWPMPARPPVRVQLLDRSEQEGYTVEKVLLETWPGFYLAGNLYRPRSHGPGPLPAILNPHGHWARGRVTDSPEGSIPARCIHFARQGMIAFAYDMVGYCDTTFAAPPGAPTGPSDYYQRHRLFPTNAAAWLWNVNLLGLQLWNSLRALDFLESLPEVDTNRIGVTGASGGATQTFLLAAVDDRPRVLAPVCMVSHTMQGGCACENVPGLRVRFSNLDFAAAAAPRPQILVAATGDWTRTTLEMEGPAVETVYRLLGAPERLRYVRFDAGHNYNRTSREAVYAWFEHWLLGRPDRPSSPELPYTPLREEQLLIAQHPSAPRSTLTPDAFLESWIQNKQTTWQARWPRKPQDLAEFQRLARPLWQHTLQAVTPELSPTIGFSPLQPMPTGHVTRFDIRYPDEPGSLQGFYYVARRVTRAEGRAPALVVWIPELPMSFDPLTPPPQVQALLRRGHNIITVTRFTSVPATNYLANFYTTYNRTPLQARVRDLITLCTSVAQLAPAPTPHTRRVLWGEGTAGIWALLAAPVADAVVADLADCELADPARLMQPDLFCPGFLAMGGAATPVLLAAPRPLYLARIPPNFPVDTLRQLYINLGHRHRFQLAQNPPDARQVLEWLGRF